MMTDYVRELTTTDFQPGDRVEILQGKNKGKTGTFVDYAEDGRAIVQSDSTGHTKPFPRSWLWLLNSVQDSSGPVEPQPLQRSGATPTLSSDTLPELPCRTSTSTVEAQPLQNGRGPAPTVEPQPLHGSGATSTVEAQPLQGTIAALEALQSRLISEGILRDCWIETYQRSGSQLCRLVYYRHTRKTPAYFPAKELEAHKKAIDRGRVLAALDVVLMYCRGNSG